MTYAYQKALPDMTARKGLSEKNTSLFFGIRTVAIIEAVTFFTAILVLDAVIGGGHRFINISPHPFWIIILLVAVQYGMAEAFMAAILASAFLLIGNLPEQHLAETMYDYTFRVMRLPFLWTVAALIFGGIRSRQLNEDTALKTRVKQSEEAAKAIADSYNSVKQSKEHLEMRLAQERCSVLTVYEVAKSLETIDSGDALSAVANLVKSALSPVKFSIYRWEDGAFHMEYAYGWKTSDTYAQRFDSKALLTSSMLKQKRTLCAIHEIDEAILAKEGLLAGLITDEKTGRIFGMLKIEKIEFMNLDIRTTQTFSILCDWIARVYNNMEKYQAVLPHNMGVLAGDIDEDINLEHHTFPVLDYKKVQEDYVPQSI